ncbi:MAG: hypothetical protein V1835_05245 [Candidatus Micrarchaeota archaeon]
MLELNIASLLASLLLFYYTYRLYGVFSDTRLQGAMQLLLNGFLLLLLQAVISVLGDLNIFVITFDAATDRNLPGLIALIAYIVIIAAMVRLRRVFMEFEVQKKAIVMLRNVFDGEEQKPEPAAEPKKKERRRR